MAALRRRRKSSWRKSMRFEILVLSQQHENGLPWIEKHSFFNAPQKPLGQFWR
jgi:hypothetical protein